MVTKIQSRAAQLKLSQARLQSIASSDPDPVVQAAAQDALDSLDPANREALAKRASAVLQNTRSPQSARLAALSTVAELVKKGPW